MAEKGIPANVHYKPLPLLSAYRNLGFKPEDYPNAIARYLNEVTLPLHNLLTDDDVHHIAEVFTSVYHQLEAEYGR
jgi:dTDP-4-amino-4,6-dideoxygalactose transaminase